jgi:ferredoxin/flavodoxin---NADP+ reductase
VRFGNEAYERFEYASDRYLLCTSRDNSGNFHGHTTDYLKLAKVDQASIVYLCGNSDMIFEAFETLTAKGIRAENINTEIYF